MIKFKGFLVNFSLVLFGLLIGFGIVELVARRIVANQNIREIGSGGYYKQDDTLGYVMKPGPREMIGPEFHTFDSVNADFMNDEPVEASVNKSKIKILALGDSHTYAVGVSRNETWPNVLEKMLFANVEQGSVYNAGAVGYSLGQYLLTYRRLKNKINPGLIIVGFSMATDLYDLIPPRLGGFIYGSGFNRLYFDLDNNGNLVEKHELIGKKITDTTIAVTSSASKKDYSIGLFSWLKNNSRTVQLLKRSKFAIWVATHLNPTGQPLWPGMETAVKAKFDSTSVDAYRWKLATRLIEQLAKETKADNVKLILVNIPYVAVVYDDIWQSSFGSLGDKYDRFNCSKRLASVCEKNNIQFIDLTNPFIGSVRKNKKWLHHPLDAHPTKEGQLLIANEIFKQIKL